MTPKQRWQAIQEIFEAALERDAADRDAFVAAACEGDEDLRPEVLSLLAAFDESEGIDQQAQAWLASVSAPLRMPSPEGRRIGAYRVLRELGAGGMGTVYLAERADGQFEHQVALKIMRPGVGAEELRRRFLHERQILAQLLHPNVARLYDGGVTEDGQPYFVMEHVGGQPIDRYCDARQLGISARLTLFKDVCRAVAYAHRNLVVHRDLKPSNILVTDEGTVKLLDFGIAKLLEGKDEELRTRTGLRVMTPNYAAPEQIRGQAITTATDVYSLGVVLYELLCGRRPYDLQGLVPSDEERVICNQDVDKPSTVVRRIARGRGAEADAALPAAISQARRTVVDRLGRRLAGDLDTVVLKAMHKEPERRYASAAELREDLERHLAGLPVRARPDTWGYRGRKFIRRHRLGVAAAVVVAAALLAGLAGTTWQARRATAQARLASSEAAKAQQVSSFLIDLFKVSDPSEALGETITAREILDQGAARIEQELAAQPEVQASMMHVMGEVYLNLGLYEQARPQLEQALALQNAAPDKHHAGVGRSLSSLGRLRYETGDYPAAESLYRQALAIRRRLYREGHGDAAATIHHNLASVLMARGAYDEAESLDREALAMNRELLGEEHLAVATNLGNLAQVFQARGAYDQAESLHRQALAMRRKLLGKDDPVVALYLNNLALVLQNKGAYAEAESLYREALALHRQFLGAAHPAAARTLSNLASLLNNRGNYAEAETLLRESLAIKRERHGEEHPSTANTMNLLALVLQAQDKYAAAESLYRQTLAVRRKVFGENHRNVAAALNDLASLHRDRGDYAVAEARYREAVEILRVRLGDEHPHVAIVSGNLATALHAQGDTEAAERLYRRALDKMEAVLPAGHPRRAAPLIGLGILWLERGEAERGEPLFRQALAIRQQALPAGNWQIAEAQNALGASLAVLGSCQEAAALLLRSYPVVQQNAARTIRKRAWQASDFDDACPGW